MRKLMKGHFELSESVGQNRLAFAFYVFVMDDGISDMVGEIGEVFLVLLDGSVEVGQ